MLAIPLLKKKFTLFHIHFDFYHYLKLLTLIVIRCFSFDGRVKRIVCSFHSLKSLQSEGSLHGNNNSSHLGFTDPRLLPQIFIVRVVYPAASSSLSCENVHPNNPVRISVCLNVRTEVGTDASFSHSLICLLQATARWLLLFWRRVFDGCVVFTDIASAVVCGCFAVVVRWQWLKMEGRQKEEMGQ